MRFNNIKYCGYVHKFSIVPFPQQICFSSVTFSRHHVFCSWKATFDSLCPRNHGNQHTFLSQHPSSCNLYVTCALAAVPGQAAAVLVQLLAYSLTVICTTNKNRFAASHGKKKTTSNNKLQTTFTREAARYCKDRVLHPYNSRGLAATLECVLTTADCRTRASTVK